MAEVYDFAVMAICVLLVPFFLGKIFPILFWYYRVDVQKLYGIRQISFVIDVKLFVIGLFLLSIYKYIKYNNIYNSIELFFFFSFFLFFSNFFRIKMKISKDIIELNTFGFIKIIKWGDVSEVNISKPNDRIMLFDGKKRISFGPVPAFLSKRTAGDWDRTSRLIARYIRLKLRKKPGVVWSV